MKSGVRIAMGLAVGYVLGRTRKMRLALTLAAAGAAGRVRTSPGDLVREGVKLLGSSPELAKLGESVRGELAGAVKSAAVSGASNRIDSLTGRIQDRTGGATGKDEGSGEAEEEDEEDEREPRGEAAERDESEPSEESEEDQEEQEESRPRASRRREASDDEGGEGSDDGDQARRRPARSGGGTRRSAPVRRSAPARRSSAVRRTRG